jgi:hypothetical protein
MLTAFGHWGIESRIDDKLALWIWGKNPLHARKNVYQNIRDIPYAIVPELNNANGYVDILKVCKGSCMPKHLLLGTMFTKLGLSVLYAVFPFRWDEARINYPAKLKTLAQEMPTSYHLSCRVELNGQLLLVDATLDPGLEKLGLPVNLEWDGISNTVLPIEPIGDEEIYHPSEASLIQSRYYDQKSLEFYRELNLWLDRARRSD